MFGFISGKIPLRQLVYRVLDLPPSMRPLVYDFGQLNMDTENDYIKQIVYDHVGLQLRTSEYPMEARSEVTKSLCVKDVSFVCILN